MSFLFLIWCAKIINVCIIASGILINYFNYNAYQSFLMLVKIIKMSNIKSILFSRLFYTKSSNYLLNRFTMSIRDKRIDQIAMKIRCQKINRFYLPISILTICNLITWIYQYFSSEDESKEFSHLFIALIDLFLIIIWFCILRTRFRERWPVTLNIWLYFFYHCVLTNLI